MGSLQAVEVIKELLGRGDSLSGTLLLYDALSATWSRIGIKRRSVCPVCSAGASRWNCKTCTENIF